MFWFDYSLFIVGIISYVNVYVASGSGMSSSSSNLSSNSGTNSGSAGTSSGPTFEEEPSDGYIVRSKSAILRCKTLNALNAWFKCNTGDERVVQSKQTVHNYVDPQTGIRIIELQLEVSRSDIDEHAKAGYTNSYQCWCTAYGGHTEIVSRRASILFSHLRKHFIKEPISQSVQLHSQTSFTCLPPDGDPKPTLFWLKNGEIITPNNDDGSTQPKNDSDDNESDLSEEEREDDDESDLIPVNLSPHHDHSNYLITHDGSLIIKQASLLDQANYTCAVKNPAGIRYSESATLIVYVNGGWSSWSPWSECNVKCGRGTQRRVRYCSNPTPLNNGQSCPGESTQVSDCSVICTPVNGQWTNWSPWSTCSHECTQVKRRTCTNPSPKYGGQHCSGPDFLIKNCTGGLCRKLDLYQLQRRENEDTGNTENEQQIYLLSIIITTVLLFLFVVIIIILMKRRQKYKNQEWNDEDEERTGEDRQTMFLLFQQPHQNHSQQQQQPDLIRNDSSEKYQLISRVNNCNSNLVEHFVVRCDPLPSVPNTNSSIDSGIASNNNNNNNISNINGNHQVNHLLTPSISGTPKVTPTSVISTTTTTGTTRTRTTVTATTSSSSTSCISSSSSSSDDETDSDEPEYAEPIFNISTNQKNQNIKMIRLSPQPPPIPSTPPEGGRIANVKKVKHPRNFHDNNKRDQIEKKRRCYYQYTISERMNDDRLCPPVINHHNIVVPKNNSLNDECNIKFERET